jgi:tetrahydromethanopterin S-methyltransferase subunit G
VPTSSSNMRLDRIEEKIDKLAEAMVSLARAEEKINILQSDHHDQKNRMNRFSAKLDDIEKKVDSNAKTVDFIHKLFWICIVTAVTGIASQIWMN